MTDEVKEPPSVGALSRIEVSATGDAAAIFLDEEHRSTEIQPWTPEAGS